MTRPVRTRIAPSPTGAPHIGTAYIALHNLAFARRHGGQFLLRIEDTDQSRSTKASEDQILESLRWLGLDWDEGPDCGGEHGPYRQSERLPIYQEHAWKLVEAGKAYPCFCTKEELDALRAEQIAKQQNPGYDGRSRNIDPAEAKARVERGESYVIRLKVPESGETKVFDDVRGQDIVFQNSEIDDQVLLKADGFPTYHLANVVDDHLMGISHVLRGEEWISSAPKHVMLYEAFGWEAPRFMHLPLLRNADKSKISKRKNPTSLTWFMARGYAREALVNFLGLMGYSFGDDREIFNFEELTKAYDASRISTTAPIFDFAKLDRFNATYVQEFSPERFQGYQQEAQQALLDYVEPLRPHLQQRVKSVFDLGRWTRFLFEREPQYRSEAFKIKKMDQAKASNTLKSLAKAFGKKRPQNMEQFKSCVYEVCQDISVPMGSACMLLRVGVMEEQESLPLFEVCEFLGSDLAIKKIKDADKFIKSGWPSPKK